MAIHHKEIVGSGSGGESIGRDGYRTLKWNVFGTRLYTPALNYLSTNNIVPLVSDGYVYKGLTWEQDTPKSWVFTANYADPDVAEAEKKQDPDGEFDWDGETSGGTIRIFKSLQTTRYPSSAADHKNVINLKDGEVEGCEKVVPALKLTFRGRHSAGWMTLARAATLAGMVGTVNNATAFGFAAGTMLYLGSTFGNGRLKDSDATYTFAVSPNLTGLSFSPTILDVAKGGHEYLWIDYRDTEVTDGLGKKRQSKTALSVYVERIYEQIDYSAFGINVTL